MDKKQISNLVIETITEYFDSQDIKTNVNESTPLIGKNSLLDSLGLVNVIVDIESKLNENDIVISIMSEKAMSEKHSPFLSIGSLINFITEESSIS